MATERSDLFVPEVMVDAISGAIAGLNPLEGTGAVVVSNQLPNSARGGDVVNVPYFGHLGEFEEVAEGVPLTIATLTSTAEQAVVQRAGKAFEITNWAQRAAAGDPYAEAAAQMRAGIARKADMVSLAAAATTDLVIDASDETLTYAHFVRLLSLFGDQQDDVVAFTMHSALLESLRLMEDGAGRLLFTDAIAGGRASVLGRPVFVSDRNTIDPIGGGEDPDVATHEVLALRRGSIAFWYNGTPNVATDVDILVDSRVASVNMYYAVHRYERMPNRTTPGVAKLEVQPWAEAA